MTLRDILNPWGALREARAALRSSEWMVNTLMAAVQSASEREAEMHAELDRLKRQPIPEIGKAFRSLTPKRDPKTGRFTK